MEELIQRIVRDKNKAEHAERRGMYMNTPVLHRIINRTAPKPVSPVIYGWHYEEIGMIGDGGRYADDDSQPGIFSESERLRECRRMDYIRNIPHADRRNRSRWTPLSADVGGAHWERVRFHRSDYSE